MEGLSLHTLYLVDLSSAEAFTVSSAAPWTRYVEFKYRLLVITFHPASGSDILEGILQGHCMKVCEFRDVEAPASAWVVLCGCKHARNDISIVPVRLRGVYSLAQTRNMPPHVLFPARSSFEECRESDAQVPWLKAHLSNMNWLTRCCD